MSYGKRAEAAFFYPVGNPRRVSKPSGIATPHFESARRQRITDPNARTCAVEDLVYHQNYPYEVANDQYHPQHHHHVVPQPPSPYERPSRPSRPVSLELQEYLRADRRPGDSDSQSQAFRELHETLSESATFVRKKVKRGARMLLVHRISIFAALLLGAAVVAVVAPERVHAVLHPSAHAAATQSVPSASAVAAAPKPAAAAPAVAKEEPKPVAPVASAPVASSVSAASSSAARPVKHAPAAAPRGNVLAIRKDRSREDKDAGWTVASPVSSNNTTTTTTATTSSNNAESDRAKQDLAAVTAALANTL